MRNRIAKRPPHTDIVVAAGVWYRQPVLWLGMLLFTASLAGCILMIVLGARHRDESLPIAGGEVAHMPVARAAAPSDAPQDGR
jgi:hypothetical protein